MPQRWLWDEGLEWTSSWLRAKLDLRGAGKRRKPDWRRVLQEVVCEGKDLKSVLMMNQHDADRSRSKLPLPQQRVHQEEGILKYRF